MILIKAVIDWDINEDCWMFHFKEDWQILSKEMDVLHAADPACIIVRSIHAPKGGASTSVRGNVPL